MEDCSLNEARLNGSGFLAGQEREKKNVKKTKGKKEKEKEKEQR